MSVFMYGNLPVPLTMYVQMPNSVSNVYGDIFMLTSIYEK